MVSLSGETEKDMWNCGKMCRFIEIYNPIFVKKIGWVVGGIMNISGDFL